MNTLKKWLPLIVLLILFTILYFSGITDFLSYDSLKQNRQKLLAFVNDHFIYASLIFIGIYIFITAISIPGAVFLTIFGGFFFGQPWSTIYVIISATIGATIIFLAAKTALRDFFEKKLRPYLQKFEENFRNHSGSYLLFLRFVPIFPFWLLNLAPAFFQVKTTTFIWTTFLGIIPGTFVFAQAGTGLGAIFDRGEEFSIKNVLNFEIRIALIALAIFALIPMIIKKIYLKRKNRPK